MLINHTRGGVGMAGPPSEDRLVLRVVILAAMLEGEERYDECSSNGQLIVDYEFVDCDDELINQPGHSKNILVSAIDRV
ncbi:BnaC05g47120D [Brassica napus]|uniref:BnaC05g47120D protein n=1 Tax=Brassica napus TaxID=3708 RepID=A0A078HVM6_BRANA|nr:BnaC05g47120D [Brassica napus]